eukprot:TRINITY_DN680_c0_g2_i4.p1 TRINITY_DN680_c0_g2~~TRINITY_DN680_c0_g2_i4.p1  ORF type:complete len:347 (-),score=22.90 TRINITY_DN680_c0_g2_i4:171-1124(-)
MWAKCLPQQAQVHAIFTKAPVQPPKQSQFQEKGILTPEEFVIAGDQLTSMCPSWSWKSAPNKKNQSQYLPPEKQYLFARVPCHKRVKEMFDTREVQGEDGWTVTLDDKTFDTSKKPHKVLDDDDDDVEVKKPAKIVSTVDPNYFDASKKPQKVIGDDDDDDDIIKPSSNAKPVQVEESKVSIEKVSKPLIMVEEQNGPRFYDLSIVYDTYFFTPRVYLVGYNANNGPLTQEEMFEDIMSEYANKTVTMEPHPQLGVPQLSIHPCKHAEVMKKLFIDTYAAQGTKLEVHQSLFVFLKFLSAIIPTMEYDFTTDVSIEQ